jgi:hypothetical protein
MNKTLNLPNFEIVKPLITDIFDRLKTVFDIDTILGFYLGGSLAIGGFDEAKSDLDFLIVLRGTPTDTEIEKLRDMHNAIKSSHKNRLYDNYEGIYLTFEQARNLKHVDMHAPHLGSEGHFGMEDHGPEVLIDLWKIRKSGFVVYGRQPKKLIGEISDDEMIQAKIDLFKSWWLPKLKRREPMDAEYQAYAVLTMTRILYGLANHAEVSKKESAAWCIDHYNRQAELIYDAIAWEPGKDLDKLEQVYGLIELVKKQIEHTS